MEQESRNLIIQLENISKESIYNEEMLAIAERLLLFSRDNGDSYGEVVALYHESLYYYRMGNTALCLKNANLSNEICEKKQFMKYYIKSCNMLGIVFSMMSEQFLSLEHLLKGYYSADKLKDYDMMSKLLNNIGDMFLCLGSYEEASKYFLKAKNCRENLVDYKDETYAIIILNIIETDVILERNKEAEANIEQIENTLGEENEKILRGIIVSNEVLYYYNAGNLAKAKEGIYYLLGKVLQYPEFTHSFNSLMRISKVVIGLGDRSLGEEYIKTIERLTERSDDINYRTRCQSIVVEYYDSINDKEKLFDSLYNYYQINQKNTLIRKNNYGNSLIAKIELEHTLQEHQETLKKNKALKFLSEVDELTGVYNRRATEKHIIDKLSSNNSNNYCAMLIIDVDHFKIINDSYGHMLGDRVLRKVGTLLKRCFNKGNIKGNIIGRMGGDEFIIYMDNVGDDRELAMSRLRKEMDEFQKKVVNFGMLEFQKVISVSIGICVIPKEEATYTNLYGNADSSLYKAKNRGRNCSVFFT